MSYVISIRATGEPLTECADMDELRVEMNEQRAQDLEWWRAGLAPEPANDRYVVTDDETGEEVTVCTS